jgi:enolase-phosphatase E1
MARDVKIAYLKSLQGYLWESGYASGELRAPLFPDVAPKIVQWTESGWGQSKEEEEEAGKNKVKVMIYSSGSVPAQKLFFGHTDAEPSDLRPRISGWFDTVNAGPKTEAESYRRIVASDENVEQVPAEEWLFLSDNVKEVEAAKEAGLQSFVVERPGNAPLSDEVRGRERVIRSFDEL